ncbi:MAG: hypothetical protein QXJ63_01980 [Candidatus Bathyarchaeia archaeon]
MVQFIGTDISIMIKFELRKSSEKPLLKCGKMRIMFLSIIITVLLTVTLTFAFNSIGHGGIVYSSTSPVKVSKLSEAPLSQWNKTYGGINQDRPLALVQTSDKGYAIACSTYSYGAGSADVWLIKTDAYGNIEWDKTYGGPSSDWASALVKTSDGDYVILGSTYSYGAGLSDAWLIKTDAYGNVKWNKTYGGMYRERAWALVQTFDGGYAIIGSTSSYWGESAVVWLVKTDSYGNMEWSKTYGRTDWSWTWALIQSSDGGYAMAGSTSAYRVKSADIWLIKTDAYGNMKWNITYGGQMYEGASALVQTSDGGYAILGSTYSYGVGSADIWFIKTDVYGNMEWNKTYGGTDWDWASALVKTSDGGYAIAGCTRSSGAGLCDVWLIKTDACGNIEWDKTYGGPSSDWASALVQSFDGGYAIACSTSSYGAGNADIWLVKLIVPECSSLTILLVLTALIALTAAFVKKTSRKPKP